MKPVTKTRLIAHRGLSSFECENTAAAFIAAGNRDYFGIETDLHQTADGAFVLLHDPETGRVADENRIVADSTLTELQALWLKDLPRKTEQTCAHLRIPTLEEYLAICKYYRKTAMLEIKMDLTETKAKALLKKIQEAGMGQNLIVIDFKFDNLVLLRKLAPNLPIQYLTSVYANSLVKRLREYRFGLDIYHLTITEEMVRELHENNILVNVWTVDDLAHAQRLSGWGVDFITTNRILSL